MALKKGSTTITYDDVRDAVLVQTNKLNVDQYHAGNIALEDVGDLADALTEVVKRVKVANRRHFLILEVTP